MKARQLPFDFGESVSFDPGDFLVAPANRDAVALLQSWPDWPANLLVLHGPPGAGKSHLARLWEEQAEARILVAAALRADMVPALSAQAVVLEVTENPEAARQAAALVAGALAGVHAQLGEGEPQRMKVGEGAHLVVTAP
ncbi:MAG: AAA family ATPase, partial [Ferrovibrionaceae bacterium]